MSESLKNLDAKIGCVFVCCVVASLAFPASSASGTSQFINRGLSTGVGGSCSDFNSNHAGVNTVKAGDDGFPCLSKVPELAGTTPRPIGTLVKDQAVQSRLLLTGEVLLAKLGSRATAFGLLWKP